MTSLKWMTVHKPHPVNNDADNINKYKKFHWIQFVYFVFCFVFCFFFFVAQIYRAIKKRGYNPKPVTVIVVFQLIYTALTFTPVSVVLNNNILFFFRMHDQFVIMIRWCSSMEMSWHTPYISFSSLSFAHSMARGFCCCVSLHFF